ncbi:fumarylacetoacetate hydrolase family protein [Candidatus Bipolaricaulota bacterium]|nr:fumarylacetoacetate hydrolase family protein [Candidatus Bipolaricaulota bacterium]
MKLARFRIEGERGPLSGEVIGDSVQTDEGSFSLSEVDLLPPVTPSKIVCVGLNYKDHIEETGANLPENPSLFFKPPTSVVGNDDPIEIDSGHRFDPEGEVGVVIGRECRRVRQSEVQDCIWGYTGLNDVTNRDAQEWEQNWIRAKGFDTAAPVGPYLVTNDQLELPIGFELKVNGEVRQSSDTSQLIFGIPDLIVEISSFMTLNRGDIISTGTPSGVAPIHGGDVVELEIEGVGTLRNAVREVA